MKNYRHDPTIEDCDCHNGTAVAEYHTGQHSDCRECGEYLVEQAEAWMQAETSEDFLSGFFAGQASLTESLVVRKNGTDAAVRLFDHFALGKPNYVSEAYEDGFDVVAMPKSRLPESLLPGDLLLSRSFGDGKVWQSMLTGGEAIWREANGSPAGWFAEVATKFPQAGHGTLRIGDGSGRLLGNQLVLRSNPGAVMGFAVEQNSENWSAFSDSDADAPALINSRYSDIGFSIHAKIPLGKDIPDKTGIFVPKGFLQEKPFDLLVYLHGMTDACPGKPKDIEDYWSLPLFACREEVRLSGRNVMLAAPSLGKNPEKLDRFKSLINDFDGYVASILLAFQSYYPYGKAIEPQRIILAAHSGSGMPLIHIATSTPGKFFSKISECWGFDSNYPYSGANKASWKDWAKLNPDKTLYLYYKANTPRKRSQELACARLPNVVVQPAEIAHCQVPRLYLKERILGLPPLRIGSAAPGSENFAEDVSTLSGSVGKKGNNKDDVLKVQQRLLELGFDWVPQTGKADKKTLSAIKLFQSIIGSNPSVRGDGTIEIGKNSHQWLMAANAPKWTRLGMGQKSPKNLGWWNSTQNDKVADYYGTDWLVNTIELAGTIYYGNYIKQHPNASVIYINDLTERKGGDTKDHAGHETGLNVDIRLPRLDGISGNILVTDCLFDRDAARAMLQAFRATPLFDLAYCNDRQLIKEGLCVEAAGHDNHIHVKIKPPVISLPSAVANPSSPSGLGSIPQIEEMREWSVPHFSIPPYQPANILYKDNNFTIPLSIIPATRFPEPIQNPADIKPVILEALSNYHFDIPEIKYDGSSPPKILADKEKAAIKLHDWVASKKDLMDGLTPLAQLFGKEAFQELLSRLRWRKQDFQSYSVDFTNKAKKTYLAQLIPRLLLHIPGHFRELARQELNEKEAFTLENLGWLLMLHARNLVYQSTGKLWWTPPLPEFCARLPKVHADAGVEFMSKELSDKTRTLGLSEMDFYLTYDQTRYYSQPIEGWKNSLPGKHWQQEVYINQGHRAFYPEVVKSLKGDVFAPVSIAFEKGEAVTAFEKYVAKMKENYPDEDIRNEKLRYGKEAGPFSGKFEKDYIKKDIPTQGVEMVYEFPKTAERLQKHPDELKSTVKVLNKLEPVVVNAFKTIRELGWNDLLYDLQGMFYFRGSGGGAPDKLSNHGVGAAMDLNAQENPGKISSRIGAMDPRIVALFDAFHFRWGATLKTPDPHHFEYRVYSEDALRNGKTIQALEYIAPGALIPETIPLPPLEGNLSESKKAPDFADGVYRHGEISFGWLVFKVRSDDKLFLGGKEVGALTRGKKLESIQFTITLPWGSDLTLDLRATLPQTGSFLKKQGSHDLLIVAGKKWINAELSSNGKGYGASAGSSSDLVKTLLRLRDAGKLKGITDDQIRIICGVAIVESSGKVNTINTYDSDYLSMGFIQFTLKGKLQELIAANAVAFERHEIRLHPTNKWGSLSAVDGLTNPDDIRKDPLWIARFYEAGLDDEIIAAQVRQFVNNDLQELTDHEFSKWGVDKSDKFFLNAISLMVIAEIKNNRPAYTAMIVQLTREAKDAALKKNPKLTLDEFHEILKAKSGEVYDWCNTAKKGGSPSNSNCPLKTGQVNDGFGKTAREKGEGILQKIRDGWKTVEDAWKDYEAAHPPVKSAGASESWYTPATFLPESAVIEYDIFPDGSITKRVPTCAENLLTGEMEYYYNVNNSRHFIAKLPFITVDKRGTGEIIPREPTGYTSVEDYPQPGDAKKKYIYPNGDIVAEGVYDKYKYLKYPKVTGTVLLVRMPDELKKTIGSVKIFYSFKNTQRRYCDPDAFAGFIGALADMSFEDVQSTGMCFADATSFPSVSHPNGDSIDTLYLKDASGDILTREQAKINAFRKFHFENIIRGTASKYSSLKGHHRTNEWHNDHLHAGDFNKNFVAGMCVNPGPKWSFPESPIWQQSAKESFAEAQKLPPEAILSDQLPFWDTKEKTAFMKKVYDAQLAHSTKLLGTKNKHTGEIRTFYAGLPDEQLGIVEPSPKGKHCMATAAAAACKALLEKARTDLAAAQADGNALAKATKSIGISSAYRSLSDDFGAWQSAFKTNFGRGIDPKVRLTIGNDDTKHELSDRLDDKDVALMVRVLSGTKAIPGFSNHTRGNAVDFKTSTTSGDLGASKRHRSKWRKAWFFDWLGKQKQGEHFGFVQLPTEEWHWDYIGATASEGSGLPLAETATPKLGWSDASSDGNSACLPNPPTAGWNKAKWKIGKIWRIPIEGLEKAYQKKDPRSYTDESAKGKAVVYFHENFDPAKPANLLLYLHGDGPGCRQANGDFCVFDSGPYRGCLKKGSVEDVDTAKIAQQLEASKRHLIAVVPQRPSGSSDLGTSLNCDAYLKEVFSALVQVGVLKKEPDICHVLLAGHSRGGDTISRIIGNKTLPSKLSLLTLMDGIHGGWATDWVREQLEAALLQLIMLDNEAGQLALLRTSLKFRAFHAGPTYDKNHKPLTKALADWFVDKQKRQPRISAAVWKQFQENWQVVDAGHDDHFLVGVPVAASGEPPLLMAMKMLPAVVLPCKGVKPGTTAEAIPDQEYRRIARQTARMLRSGAFAREDEPKVLPAAIARRSGADIFPSPDSSKTKVGTIAKDGSIEEILEKKKVGNTWWFNIRYTAGGTSKTGWALAAHLMQIANPATFVFSSSGGTGSGSPFEDLRKAVKAGGLDAKIARAINFMNLTLAEPGMNLGDFTSNVYYHSLMQAKGELKQAALIATAAFRATKSETGGVFLWVQSPAGASFDMGPLRDKLWHFFWNASLIFGGDSLGWTDFKGRAYEFRSDPGWSPSRDAKEDIIYNRAGIAFADWGKKNKDAHTYYHVESIKKEIRAVIQKDPELAKMKEAEVEEVISRMMKDPTIEVEIRQRLYKSIANGAAHFTEAAQHFVNKL